MREPGAKSKQGLEWVAHLIEGEACLSLLLQHHSIWPWAACRVSSPDGCSDSYTHTLVTAISKMAGEHSGWSSARLAARRWCQSSVARLAVLTLTTAARAMARLEQKRRAWQASKAHSPRAITSSSRCAALVARSPGPLPLGRVSFLGSIVQRGPRRVLVVCCFRDESDSHGAATATRASRRATAPRQDGMTALENPGCRWARSWIAK